MKIFFFIFFLNFALKSQSQVVINLNKKSINILIVENLKYIENKRENIFNTNKYIYLKKDTNYYCYNENFSKQSIKKDTFFYIRTEIIRTENILGVVPTLYRESYQLNQELIGKNLNEKESMINNCINKKYKWTPSKDYFRLSCKVTPVQYYQGKYPYVDVYKTYYEKGAKKKWYTSNITRIFIIDNYWYYIYVFNRSLKTSKSIFRSRKAVCCDFKRLVNNIKIIEAEEGCGGN